GIAEIIEHERLIWLELKGVEEIGFGALPLARSLERNAAAIEQGPALRQVCGLKTPDGLVIRFDRFGKPLLATQEIAELHFGAGPCRRLRRHFLELSDRLVGAVQHLEIGGNTQPG